MSRRDLFLALLVVTIWGANFTVIKLGLQGIPPLQLATLRFLLAAFPAVFFIRRPAVAPRYWIAYGATVGAGQFGCLFVAIHIGMPAGIASVVLQAQAFFTLIFGGLFLGERLTVQNFTGLTLASFGLYVVSNNSAATTTAIPFEALVLTLIAAAFWGISNIIVRRASAVARTNGDQLNMLSLVVWSSLIPPLPLALINTAFFSSPSWLETFATLNGLSMFSIAYLALAATLFGYGAWSVLLARHPASQVAPLSLLVPVTGLITAVIVLHESLSLQQAVGCALVLSGLLISMRKGRLWHRSKG